MTQQNRVQQRKIITISPHINAVWLYMPFRWEKMYGIGFKAALNFAKNSLEEPFFWLVCWVLSDLLKNEAYA